MNGYIMMEDLESRIKDRAFDILKRQVSTGRGSVVEPIEDLQAGAFWDDVSSGLKHIVPFYKPVVEALGYGKKKKAKKQPKKKIVNVQEIMEMENISPPKGAGLLEEIGKFTRLLPLIGLGEKPKRKPSQRNIMIKKVMKAKNMTLPEASNYIKMNNMMK